MFDLPYSHVLKAHIESLTEEVIQLCQENNEQQKTLNRADNYLERLCNVNSKNQSYTASKDMYKSNKVNVYLKSAESEDYSVSVTYTI